MLSVVVLSVRLQRDLVIDGSAVHLFWVKQYQQQLYTTVHHSEMVLFLFLVFSHTNPIILYDAILQTLFFFIYYRH